MVSALERSITPGETKVTDPVVPEGQLVLSGADNQLLERLQLFPKGQDRRFMPQGAEFDMRIAQRFNREAFLDQDDYYSGVHISGLVLLNWPKNDSVPNWAGLEESYLKFCPIFVPVLEHTNPDVDPNHIAHKVVQSFVAIDMALRNKYEVRLRTLSERHSLIFALTDTLRTKGEPRWQ